MSNAVRPLDVRRPPTRWSGLIRGALQTAIALALLILWLRTVSLGEVLGHARVHSWPAVVLMFVLFLATSLIRARRWLLLLRPLAPVGMVRAFAMNAGASLLNYVLPIRSGDAMRGWWLWRRHRVPPGSAVATIVIDKACDLAGVAIVLATISVVAASGLVSAPRGLFGAAALAVVLLAAVIGTALLGPRIARSPLARRILPESIAAGLAGQAFAFRAGAKGLWTPSLAVRLAALTAIALLIDAFNFSLLFWAVGVPVPTLKAMAAYPALLLAFAVPAGPGYVGSLEVAGSLVLGGGLGLSSAVAAGAIVLYHAITAAYALVLGFLGFLLVGGKRSERAGGPRRIAVFHCGFTYSGGGERIVIEEVLGLRRRGYKVECYAPTVDASRCYPDLIGDVGVRTFLPQLPRWFPFREAVQMAATSLLMPLYAWRFRGVDAIVGCNQPSAWIAWWAARLIDVPYVVYLNQPNRLVYPRSIDRETGWVANADYRLLAAIVMRATRFVAWADRRSVQEADQLLVNGDYIGDIIRGIYRRDAVDCPAGCHVASSGFPLPEQARFSGGLTINGYPIRRPYVLLTNRHYPQKRFDLAIRSMQEVRKRHPKVQLVVPGPATAHTAVLKTLTGELGLNDAVLFLGAITEDELQKLYEGAAVYVYPAPEEDFGMGVIESMAKGVPVVAWNQAGPTVTVGAGTGHLAEPLEVGDYANGIAGLLDDPAANQATGARAFEWARRFDWERHVDTLERSILEVARSHEQLAVEARTA
ncbi:MAG TPA: lysylphosphatidylglycerol synthase domain-containing protein [Candidatus Dormibacteraeota bacterium]|nr:lysylphosphatidylglycerol synthase domain-containing protein [Candidatus Dormibacteraeota bacterium]